MNQFDECAVCCTAQGGGDGASLFTLAQLEALFQHMDVRNTQRVTWEAFAGCFTESVRCILSVELKFSTTMVPVVFLFVCALGGDTRIWSQ